LKEQISNYQKYQMNLEDDRELQMTQRQSNLQALEEELQIVN